MKICFITDTIFNIGGIQRVVSVLSSELSKYFIVDILCTDNRHKIDRNLYGLSDRVNILINEDLVKIKVSKKICYKFMKIINERSGLLNNELFIDILTEVYYPKELQDKFIGFINSNKYDIVIGNSGYYSLILGIIGERLNAKTVGWQHNACGVYLKTPHKYNWKEDELFKKYISKLDRYVVLTDNDKKIIEKSFDVVCKRIYNPRSFKSAEKSQCEENNIITVGRLEVQQKGIDLLIQAFNKIYMKHRDWKLYVVGEGCDKDKVTKLINKLNMKSAVIIENFTNNIKDYYLKSSIFVSSSRWEGFGLVILEAMECGIPVISFENSGPKEIINKNNYNGVLVPCGDIDKLADAMERLIINKEERKKIAINSIKRAKDFDIDIIANQWKKMFYEI